MSEEEKNFLLKQADMYLSGMSFRQISKEVGQSHVTVRDNITSKIKNIDPNKYDEVIKKIFDNSEKTIKDDEVRERILEAYKLLTEENMTVVEIANSLKTTEFTIYRDLTKRLKMLNEAAPQVVTFEMVTKAAAALQKHQLDNLVTKKSQIDIDLLYRMFPTESKRNEFLTKCILTYGLRLDTVSMILNKDSEQINKALLYNTNRYYQNVKMIFLHGMKRQDTALLEFKDFYLRLSRAFISKDRKSVEEILSEISDKNASMLINKKEQSRYLSDEDILVILRYQLKYMIDLKTVEKIFKLDRRWYPVRVRKLESEYPELVSDFNYLCDYYQNLYQLSGRRGR